MVDDNVFFHDTVRLVQRLIELEKEDFETAIYLLKGKVETKFGKNLKESIVNEEGDFIYIPPGVPHKPVNLSDSELALAIVSRNDPNEHENVVPYDQ